MRIKHIQNRENKQNIRQKQLFDSNNKSKKYGKRNYSGHRITKIKDAGGRKHIKTSRNTKEKHRYRR